MKNPKCFFLSIALILFTVFKTSAQTQTIAEGSDQSVKIINGLKTLVTAVSELWTSFSTIEDQTNQKKTKDMAARLRYDIGKLINTKILLKDKIEADEAITDEVTQLTKGIDALQETLLKYDELLAANGIAGQALRESLELDINLKEQKVKRLQFLAKSNADKDAMKKQILAHLDQCINLLKDAQKVLDKFGA